MNGQNEVGAVVVGAGLGGLSAALSLAAEGQRVIVCEKNAEAGGKCGIRRWQGHAFDTGPSLLTLPFVLHGLFEKCGKAVDDYLTLQRLDPVTNYQFADGSTFSAPGTLEGWQAAIASHFPDERAGFEQWLRHARQLYEVSGPLFLFDHFRWWSAPAKLRLRQLIPALAALRPESMQQSIRRHFRDPRLIQLFERYATYNGSEPGRAPATFNVIPYVEMAFGGWHVVGGMYALVEALVKLAADMGVELRTECAVERVLIDRSGATGVALQNGGTLTTRRVVVNADAATALDGDLLKDARSLSRRARSITQAETSSSGFVLLLALQGSTPGLGCHTICFNGNYAQEFDQLFHHPRPLTDPTLYVSAPCVVDESQAPEGTESWFVLVNAPSLDRWSGWDESAYADFLLERLEERVPGFNRERILWRDHYGPRYFAERYGAWHGSLYGLSSNSVRRAFFRVPNESRVPGLYFCGGTAHPGGGIPLVLLSGQLAAHAACE